MRANAIRCTHPTRREAASADPQGTHEPLGIERFVFRSLRQRRKTECGNPPDGSNSVASDFARVNREREEVAVQISARLEWARAFGSFPGDAGDRFLDSNEHCVLLSTEQPILQARHATDEAGIQNVVI